MEKSVFPLSTLSFSLLLTHLSFAEHHPFTHSYLFADNQFNAIEDSTVELPAYELDQEAIDNKPALTAENKKDIIPAEDVVVELINEKVHLHADGTYDLLYTEHYSLNTAASLKDQQIATSFSYYPEEQDVKLVSAKVIMPKTSKVINITDRDVYITGPKSKEYPTIEASKMQNVALPSLTPGCHIEITWSYHQKQKGLFPYADLVSPAFKYQTLKTAFDLTAPASMKLRWARKGPFQVDDTRNNGIRHIHAVLLNQPSHHKEPFMESASDFQPYFEVSSIKSWTEVGKIADEAMQASQQVTPMVQHLVNKITEGKKGFDGVLALYDWIADNIYYLNTSRTSLEGHVPTSAEEILKERYGDCKDHASLFQTFLKAYGVDSEAVFSNWDDSFQVAALPIVSFNHQLLYIPKYKLYANPTNSYQPLTNPLEQTNFYDEHLQTHVQKPVLFAAGEHSGLSELPTPIADNERYLDKEYIQIDPQNDMYVEGTLDATGVFDSHMRGRLKTAAENYAATQLRQNGISGEGIFRLADAKDLKKPMHVPYRWHSANIVNSDAEGLLTFTLPNGVDFFTPAFFNQFVTLNQRMYPIVVVAGVLDWDFKVALPNGIQYTKIPDDLSIKNKAGEFSSHYSLSKDKNILFAKRHLKLNQLIYTGEEYPALQHLIQQVAVDAKSNISAAQPQ